MILLRPRLIVLAAEQASLLCCLKLLTVRLQSLGLSLQLTSSAYRSRNLNFPRDWNLSSECWFLALAEAGGVWLVLIWDHKSLSCLHFCHNCCQMGSTGCNWKWNPRQTGDCLLTWRIFPCPGGRWSGDSGWCDPSPLVWSDPPPLYINSHNNNNNKQDSLGRFPQDPDHRLVEEDGDDRRDDEEGDQLVDGDCTASPGMSVSRRVLGALEDLHWHGVVAVLAGLVGVDDAVDILRTSHQYLKTLPGSWPCWRWPGRRGHRRGSRGRGRPSCTWILRGSQPAWMDVLPRYTLKKNIVRNCPEWLQYNEKS